MPSVGFITEFKHLHKPRGASLHKHRTGTARRIAELFRRHLTNSQMHFAMAEILAYLTYHEVRRQAERARWPDGVFGWWVVRDSPSTEKMA